MVGYTVPLASYLVSKASWR